jgi:HSP20 family protein
MSEEKTGPMEKVLREVEEALTTFYETIGKHHKGVSGGMTSEFTPLADVAEADSSIRIYIELPGLSKDDIEIEVADGWLTVSGDKRDESAKEEDGVLVRECHYGAFSRRFIIPQGTDTDSIQAVMNNGRLDIRVPVVNSQSSDPKRIKVREQ